MCAPGHAEWDVCLPLGQVVSLTDTRQTEVCDESCKVYRSGWGRDRARGQRACDSGGVVYGAIENWTSKDLTCGKICTLCYVTSTPFPSLSPPPLPAACLVLDGWRRAELQVGSDRKDEEFSNELREDCEERGMERNGGEKDPRQ